MDNMVNTNEMRWFVRHVPGVQTGVKVLQQRWVVVGTMHGDLTDANSEWRDVPTVDEALK